MPQRQARVTRERVEERKRNGVRGKEREGMEGSREGGRRKHWMYCIKEVHSAKVKVYTE